MPSNDFILRQSRSASDIGKIESEFVFVANGNFDG